MKRYIVVGLESSCTRVVSRLVAMNLGIIESVDDWDGFDVISNDNFMVVHRSIPHGGISDPNGRSFITQHYALDFDYVVVCTRDYSCQVLSKVANHQPDYDSAINENIIGTDVLKSILNNHPHAVVFSYESAYLLQEAYTATVLKALGIDNPQHAPINQINAKYIKDDNE